MSDLEKKYIALRQQCITLRNALESIYGDPEATLAMCRMWARHALESTDGPGWRPSAGHSEPPEGTADYREKRWWKENS